MRKIVFIILIFVFVLTGCEVKLNEPKYRYQQDKIHEGESSAGLNKEFYFNDNRKAEAIIDTSFFPTAKFEEEFIGEFVGAVRMSTEQQIEIKMLIDRFLKSYYDFSGHDDISELNDVSKCVREDTYRKSKEIFMDRIKDIKEFGITIDIISAEIKGYIAEFTSLGQSIIRVPCRLQIEYYGTNREGRKEFEEINNQYVHGDDNFVDIYLYIQCGTEYQINAWIESWKNPHSVYYYDKNGQRVIEKICEDTWNYIVRTEEILKNFVIDEEDKIEESKVQTLKSQSRDFLVAVLNLNECDYVDYVQEMQKYGLTHENIIKDNVEYAIKYFDVDTNFAESVYYSYSEETCSGDSYAVFLPFAYDLEIYGKVSPCLTINGGQIPSGNFYASLYILFKEVQDNKYLVEDFAFGDYRWKPEQIGYDHNNLYLYN